MTLRQCNRAIGTSLRQLTNHGVTLVGRAIATDGRTVRFADERTREPSTIVWATGFQSDYSALALPAWRDQHRVVAFDLETFIADCLAAAPDQKAVAGVVERAISDPTALEETLTRKLKLSNLGILHYSEQLTVQHVVLPPTFRTGVHDHLTWAVIGTWGGYEDNYLFAREGTRAVQTSVERCEPGQVLSLSVDAIHDVHSPPSTGSAAIHVYGGALFDQPRHGWNPDEAPVDDAADLDRMLAGLRASGYLFETN